MRQGVLALTCAVVLAATGCQQPATTPTGPRATPPTAIPTVVTGPRQAARVARVIDGDTIDVTIGDARERIRLIGIDTPETKHPSKPVQCFGERATARTTELLQGKDVGLERDVTDRDRYRRLLRYVWLGERLVNAQLVEEGYAQASTYPPDVKHNEGLQQLQREAREAGRGLWGECRDPASPSAEIEPTTEDGGATPVPQAPPSSGGRAPPASKTACPAGHPIKGNRSSKELIYHVPGGRFYDRTGPEDCFATEDDARAAGYRKSQQ